MPITAYEYARHHLSPTVAEQYVLQPKPKSPKTLKAGQTLLGVEVIPSSTGDYPTVKTHAIEVLGFCEQSLFVTSVSRARKRVRTFATHPIESDLQPEMYTKLSKFRKDNEVLGQSHYEEPTMVAKLLVPAKKPFVLLQAHDDLYQVNWKNGASEIAWFELVATPEPAERSEIQDNPPARLTQYIHERDQAARPLTAFVRLSVGALLRPHHLQMCDLIATHGTLTDVSLMDDVPKAYQFEFVNTGRVVGFMMLEDLPSYLQPETFAELEQRLTERRQVHSYEGDQLSKKRWMSGVQWQAMRRHLPYGDIDLTEAVHGNRISVYPTWKDIPPSMLAFETDVDRFVPKVLLLVEDLATTEVYVAAEIHVPSLQPELAGQSLELRALYVANEPAECDVCHRPGHELDFSVVDYHTCLACTTTQAYALTPPALHPLLTSVLEDVVQEFSLNRHGLMLRTDYGGPNLRAYKGLLDDTFVLRQSDWVDDLAGDFDFACNQNGQAGEYVSEIHQARVTLIDDDMCGVYTRLQVFVEDEELANLEVLDDGGVQ